mgnify:FL=1
MEISSGREFPIARLILSFVIATVLFIIIFLFVNSVSYLNYQSAKANNEIINISLYVGNINCTFEYFYNISALIYNSGVQIGLLEERLGKNDPAVLELKKSYTALQFKHLFLVKEFNEKCNKNLQIILFFYSNDDEIVKESEKVGYILDTLKSKYPNKLMIYSFDVNLDQSEIQNEILKYKLKTFPAVILNNMTLPKIKNIKQIEESIK